jgi:hypothetical protein
VNIWSPYIYLSAPFLSCAGNALYFVNPGGLFLLESISAVAAFVGNVVVFFVFLIPFLLFLANSLLSSLLTCSLA